MNRPRYNALAQDENCWITAPLDVSSVQQIVICKSDIKITSLTSGVAETSGDNNRQSNKAAENERV